jgi:hypothetical protein
MKHPLQCRCETLKGFVDDPQNANRGICYCKDCQAFAHFLGRAREILDPQGGTDVIQVLPKNITLTQGLESLACMRLTEKGLLRWYTACCNTPVGNTLANYKISFIGLVHNCLETDGVSLQESFGPVRAWVNTQGAKASPKPKQAGAGRFASRFITAALKARLNGSYKTTPFFRQDGTPITTPRILTGTELTKVMQSVG